VTKYEGLMKNSQAGENFIYIPKPHSVKDGFKGNDSLISWMLAPLWCFLCVKKQQYQGEIALVTNLRPLMSVQLLKFIYILYCLNGEYNCWIFINIWSNFNDTFCHFLSSKIIMKYIRKKIDLTYLTGDFYCCFLSPHKKHPRGASIHEIKESFPLKPSLVL
jgi:hypothetical protein